MGAILRNNIGNLICHKIPNNFLLEGGELKGIFCMKIKGISFTKIKMDFFRLCDRILELVLGFVSELKGFLSEKLRWIS